MRNMFLALATVIVFATAMTTSAVAFDSNFQNGIAGGTRFSSLHSGYGSFRGDYGGSRRDNFAGIRGYSSWRQGGLGAHRSVGGHGGYNY
jgi:hypothetical protein